MAHRTHFTCSADILHRFGGSVSSAVVPLAPASTPEIVEALKPIVDMMRKAGALLVDELFGFSGTWRNWIIHCECLFPQWSEVHSAGVEAAYISKWATRPDVGRADAAAEFHGIAVRLAAVAASMPQLAPTTYYQGN